MFHMRYARVALKSIGIIIYLYEYYYIHKLLTARYAGIMYVIISFLSF